MASGMSSGHLLFVAFIFRGWGCCQAQANASATPHNQHSITINTVTYPVTDGGSGPIMSGIGSSILDGLADTPTDATLLELTSFSPDYGTVKDYISAKQSTINSFITYLWLVLGLFVAAIVITVLMRFFNGCGARRKQRVTQNYMLAYVLYLVILGILLLFSVALLVWLVVTSDAMTVALKDWAPDLYNTTFVNLKLFVNLTVDQIAKSRRKPLPPDNVSRILGPGFSRAFQKFIADSVMEDVGVPLYHMARDCANDLRHLGRALNAAGHAHLGVTFRTIGDQYAHIHRDNEELFENVAQAVAHTTAPYRMQLLNTLTDAMSTLDASDVDVAPSYTSIDMLQNKLQGFEEYHGVHKYLTDQAVLWLWSLTALFSVALALLVICLLTGVAVHNRSVLSHNRSPVSHFIGYTFIITAYVFSAFVILAIITVIYLTVYNTLGYCHFCSTYFREEYTILDDATDRLWPVSNRSQLLSKIIPSEILGKCENESVSIFDLGPMPSHRRTLHHHDLDVPQVSAHAVQQKLTYLDTGDIINDPSSSHEDLFRRLLSTLKNVSSTDGPYFKDVRKTARSIYDKWYEFWAGRNMPRLGTTSIKRVLVPMVPAYFRRFVKDVTQDVENSTSSTTAVIGPCFIIYNLITSVMNVICKGFVLELVGHWASLLFSITAAILIVIFCFWLSKYFFRTDRSRKEVLRTSSISSEGAESSSWSSSLMARTTFIRTTSRTSMIHYPFYAPSAYSVASQLHWHYPAPFSSFPEPTVVQSTISSFASAPAVLHHHPIVGLTSEAPSHVQLRRISSLTAVHSVGHEHTTVVTPVRHTHSLTTVVTPISSPLPQQVIVATPPAPVMMSPPLIIQPPMPQVVYPPPPPTPPPPPAPLLPFKRRSSSAPGGGQAANQQAATAHTTINFYGLPGPTGYGLVPQAQPMYPMPPMYTMPTTSAAIAQAPAYQYVYQTVAPAGTTSLRRATSLSRLYGGTSPATVTRVVSASQIYGGGVQVPATYQHIYPTLSQVPQRTSSLTHVAAHIVTSAPSPF